MTDERWQGWETSDLGKKYGEVFFQRATGAMGEMESSKAAARRMRPLVREGDTILDVGCGAGHYLKSLQREIDVPFRYIGADATPSYIEHGRKAFAGNSKVEFHLADIFALPFSHQTADVVMCNNVLLHLPSIAEPLNQLVAVAKRHLLIRTLVGKESFIIRHVDPVEDGNEFDASCEPREFHFLNIYSDRYIRRQLEANPRVRFVTFELDRDFDATGIADTAQAMPDAWDATRVINGLQVSSYIIQPWTWVQVELS